MLPRGELNPGVDYNVGGYNIRTMCTWYHMVKQFFVPIRQI